MQTGMVQSIARVFIGLVLLVMLGSPTPGAAQTPASGERLDVVATFSILGDMVSRVGGDAIDLHVLVGSGVDTHTYDPSPADLALLEEADVVFENGLEFETWLERFYESTDPTGTRVVVTEGIEPRAASEEHEEHEGEEHAEEGEEGVDAEHEATPHSEENDEHEGEDAHHHGEFDPHVWHDVSNAIVMVENIRDALVAADPANAETYEANASSTMTDLEALDAWVREEIATLPQERRKLVTSHDTFGYFADAYGFEVLGTALGSLSTEVGDPSAQEIAALIDEIEASGVPAIFAENVTNPDLMQSIAAEAGVTLAPTLYTDALGPAGSAGATYDGLMRSNVTKIVEALGGDAQN